jgi:choline dehydrogenase-like flavoprotein
MVPISLPSNPFGQDKGIIGVTKELPNDFPYAEDMNTGNSIGIGYVQAAIGGGKRSSSASTYLAPSYQKRPNLSILVQAQATKIVQTGTFRGKPIFGRVEFVVSGTTKRYTVSADKEVIVSAGTFNTPHLLLNSGIGDRNALTKLNIKSIVDLPDVGQQMSDHTLLSHCYSVNITSTLDDYFQKPDMINQAMGQWNASHTGMYASTVANHIGFLRVPPTDPIFKTYKDPSTGPTSGHYEFFFGASLNLPNVTYPGGHYACLLTQTMAPSSRGSITLASNDPLAPPLIDPNFIGDAFDVNTMVVAQKAAIKYFKTKAMAYMNPQPFGDWADVIKNGTDAALVDYARKNSMTIWHACSSARMSPFGAK